MFARALLATCPDKVYPGMGTGGPNAAAILNVSGMGECCDLCHGQYHDECVTWIYGEVGTHVDSMGEGYPPHNCAIMPSYHAPRPTAANTTSGVVAHPPAPGPSPPPPGGMGAPCNADLDCAPSDASTKFWRCKADGGKPPRNASNNCHIPGPGTAGNASCACLWQKCSATPATPTNASATQLLVIGDSISQGMEGDLKKLVNGKGWEYTHNPGNAASSNLGAHCINDWTTRLSAAPRTWDIISYQFGLHDLGFDTERISVEDYTALLTNITAVLAQIQKDSGMHTKLIWVKTTPVPTVPCYDSSPTSTCNETSKCLNPPRYDADVVVFNGDLFSLSLYRMTDYFTNIIRI